MEMYGVGSAQCGVACGSAVFFGFGGLPRLVRGSVRSGGDDRFRTSLATPAKEVWPTLNAKLRRHCQYFGINDNWLSLMTFREAAIRLTIRWLRRRSPKASMSWQDFNSRLTHHPIAVPRTLKNLIASG